MGVLLDIPCVVLVSSPLWLLLPAVVMVPVHRVRILPPLQPQQQAGLVYRQKLRSLPRLMSETLQPSPAHMLRSYAENLIMPIPRLTLTPPSRSCSRLLTLALHTPVQARSSRSGPDLEHFVLDTSDPVPLRLHGQTLARLLQLGLREGTGLLRVALELLCEVTTLPRPTVQ